MVDEEKPVKVEKPKKGSLCPWAREAAIATGKPFHAELVQCSASCPKWGQRHGMVPAMGCTRDR